MHVPAWGWVAAIIFIAAVMSADIAFAGRGHKQPSLRKSLMWALFSVAAAALFAAILGVTYGDLAVEQFAGIYLTEYSLSMDNLFVFLAILARFATPSILHQRVTALGIGLALALRAAAIGAGVAAIHANSWLFYFFGSFLFYTSWKILRSGSDDDGFQEGALLRRARKVLPLTANYHGERLFIRRRRRILFTPLFVVALAIGTTDIIFAMDSIPASLGLSDNMFIILTANAFALTGLRQLLTLIAAVTARLIYLPQGIAIVLALIGAKLVLQAAHDNTFDFLNNGQPLPLPTIDSGPMLVAIISVLAVAALASTLSSRRQATLAEPESNTPLILTDD
ncbi:MAG: TerC/Alx family metal homeostasis membrane protein [Pseudonocardia sp.]|nr:TerC/Alx family metal homeostasis membrane protein [Pseudonocardia sp.]